MKKLLPIVIVAVLCVTLALGVFAACDTTQPVVGLLALHDSKSTYDKNFINAFKAACEKKGLTEKQYKIVTNVPEDTKCYDRAAELADAGCKAIFADSFGHEAHMLKAAKDFPEVQFCHATGTQAVLNKDLTNYHNAFASIYQARYLAGVAAGMKLQEMIANKEITESDMVDGSYLIGYVGAYTYAEVISGYTSFYLGVKSIVENVKMEVTFTGSWYDQTAEQNAATKLIKDGCVLVSQHADSMGAPTACENAGVPNVCYNVSTATECPDTYIIASRINWQPYFEMMLDYVLGTEGATLPNDWTGDMTTGSVEVMGLGSAAAKGTQDKLNEVTEAIKNKTLKIFDTSKFTVSVGEKTNVGAEVDENGHLTSYIKNVDGTEKNVVANGEFCESALRSAPYFDLQIDGIKLLNEVYD